MKSRNFASFADLPNFHIVDELRQLLGQIFIVLDHFFDLLSLLSI